MLLECIGSVVIVVLENLGQYGFMISSWVFVVNRHATTVNCVEVAFDVDSTCSG